jgi:hypothetical protein
MKLRFALCFLFASLFACKKDNDGGDKPKTILLSVSLSNGHPANRFYYSADNKLIRFESFEEQSPNSLTNTVMIEYDQAGTISRTTSYKEPGHVAAYRTVIDSTSNGNIVKASSYDLLSATPNTPNSTQKRSYNAQGRLSKVESRDKNGKLTNYINVSYYADGSVKQIDQYQEESNQLYQVGKTVYAIPGAVHPKGLQSIESYLGPEYSALFLNEAFQTFNYDQNGVISYNIQYQMSARQYNSDSTLKSQTITIKKIKPAHADVIVFKQYEYITQ